MMGLAQTVCPFAHGAQGALSHGILPALTHLQPVISIRPALGLELLLLMEK
jgi:hypothetical protein